MRILYEAMEWDRVCDAMGSKGRDDHAIVGRILDDENSNVGRRGDFLFGQKTIRDRPEVHTYGLFGLSSRLTLFSLSRALASSPFFPPTAKYYSLLTSYYTIKREWMHHLQRRHSHTLLMPSTHL